MGQVNQQVNWQIVSFDKLDNYTLYAILKLRNEIFIIEQNCIYLDLDDKDQIAIHLLGFIDESLVAYCRLFINKIDVDQASIGRVVVSSSFRKQGIGNQLLRKAITTISEISSSPQIVISAQLYLKKFYESHGFEIVGEMYLEDGIPHIKMIRKNIPLN